LKLPSKKFLKKKISVSTTSIAAEQRSAARHLCKPTVPPTAAPQAVAPQTYNATSCNTASLQHRQLQHHKL